MRKFSLLRLLLALALLAAAVCAPFSKASVTPLIAEAITTTRGQLACAACTISAVARIAAALPTDVPPNFITSVPMCSSGIAALSDRVTQTVSRAQNKNAGPLGSAFRCC